MYRYFMNPFKAVTDGSAKRALLLGRDHTDKLFQQQTTDTELVPLYGYVSTAFKTFEDFYSELHNNEAFYKGNTQMLETMMRELSSNKIRQWDVQIQNVFMNDTPQYTMLLPQNRQPFQKGAYEMRLDTLRTFSKSLARFTELSSIKDDADLFLSKINSIRSNQQQVESVSSVLRQDVEAARIELVYQMHRVFGYLLFKHYRTPADLSRYYEMKYLQTPAATTNVIVSYEKYSVSSNSRINLYNGQLTAQSYITIKNTGSVPLKIFTTTDNNATLPDDVTTVAIGSTYGFYANEESNDNMGYNWLVVVNDEGTNGKFEAHKEEIELE